MYTNPKKYTSAVSPYIPDIIQPHYWYMPNSTLLKGRGSWSVKVRSERRLKDLRGTENSFYNRSKTSCVRKGSYQNKK